VDQPGDDKVTFAGDAGICGYCFSQCVRNVRETNACDIYRGAAEKTPAHTRNTRKTRDRDHLEDQRRASC
jgi:hypothetical protein